MKAFFAVECVVHCITRSLQTLGNERSDLAIILDDQYSHSEHPKNTESIFGPTTYLKR
jgi:hypothetical protein